LEELKLLARLKTREPIVEKTRIPVKLYLFSDEHIKTKKIQLACA
jgi:hypothetical protein